MNTASIYQFPILDADKALAMNKQGLKHRLGKRSHSLFGLLSGHTISTHLLKIGSVFHGWNDTELSIFRHCYLMIRYTLFIRYVYDFYRPGWLYPYAFSLNEILQALHVYVRDGKWGGGDSVDRENVRDLIFRDRGVYGEYAL